MPQSPDIIPQISPIERPFANERHAEVHIALQHLLDAAVIEVVPDPSHFQPTTTKEMLFATPVSREQALQEYSDNVERNFKPASIEVVQSALEAMAPATDWQTANRQSSARAQVATAHQQDYPLPTELTDA